MRRTFVGQGKNGFFGCLVFQAYFFADQRNQLVLGVRAGIGRDDIKYDNGVRRPPNECDSVVNTPAHHVRHDPLLALCHAQDAVSRLQLS